MNYVHGLIMCGAVMKPVMPPLCHGTCAVVKNPRRKFGRMLPGMPEGPPHPCLSRMLPPPGSLYEFEGEQVLVPEWSEAFKDPKTRLGAWFMAYSCTPHNI